MGMGMLKVGDWLDLEGKEAPVGKLIKIQGQKSPAYPLMLWCIGCTPDE